ncbi:MAG: hypothetical protein PF569_07215 [Candidatus Woesearchaeota archaeon]|jgi:hypothetical protein|nr:hypothetical protein [Candidatus Woesearchaeota archaeon]
MEYQENFDIDFKFEGTSLEMLPSNYSFSIEDSIYETYPKGEFILDDSIGILQDMLFTIEGAKYELTIGFGDESITNPFIVKDDTLDESLTVGLVNGDVKVRLIHEFKDKQEIASKHFKDKISSIVKSLAGSFPFAKFNIDETGNNQSWYQLLKNQVDFINENLLPFAFSNSANKSPFFFFIDNKNQYNFKNFYSMIRESKTIPLYLSNKNKEGSNNESILGIKRLRKGLDITYDLRHRRIFSFDSKTSDIVETEDYLADYPSDNKSIPIIADKTLATSYYLQDDGDGTTVSKENLKGLLNSSMKNSMTLDRFVISLPFNPSLIAGVAVELIIPSSEDSDTSGFSMLGVYLIEKSVVVWDGKNQMASTHCVIGRKSTFLPSSVYALKGRLINA